MQELVLGQRVMASRAASLRKSRGVCPTAGVRPAVLWEAAPCTVALCLAVPLSQALFGKQAVASDIQVESNSRQDSRGQFPARSLLKRDRR